MEIDPEGLSTFFRVNKSRFGKCLEPRMQCGQSAIRAHSIQNAQTMELLAEDGHVFVLRPRFNKDGPEIEFKLIGRNEASTFNGFCNEHDTNLFKPLDTKTLNPSDHQQLFLLSYRAVTRELHAIMDAAIKSQTMYNSAIERGVDTADAESPAGQLATQQMMLSYSTWRYRYEFYDKAFLAGDNGNIVFDVMTLKTSRPCLAVSAFFTVEDRKLAIEELAGVTLNVIPVTQTETVVIFGYAKPDLQVARRCLDRILNSAGDYQKYELSKLILSRVENFVLAPLIVNSWSEEKLNRVKETFARTILNHSEIEEHHDLMLFS